MLTFGYCNKGGFFLNYLYISGVIEVRRSNSEVKQKYKKCAGGFGCFVSRTNPESNSGFVRFAFNVNIYLAHLVIDNLFQIHV
jgi:hypothetical protein